MNAMKMKNNGKQIGGAAAVETAGSGGFCIISTAALFAFPLPAVGARGSNGVYLFIGHMFLVIIYSGLNIY